MSARLTPRAIADRERERLAQREARLRGELREVEEQQARWAAVLEALDGNPPTTSEDQE